VITVGPLITNWRRMGEFANVLSNSSSEARRS
jgi:hypothetical protein